MFKRLKVITIISIAFFLFATGFLIKHFTLKKDNYDEYKIPTSSEIWFSNSLSKNEPIDNPIDFVKLKEENNEVVGWIQIPDTVIDYPILQSGLGTEEDFYLTKDMYKQKKSEGSIYIQKMNSPDFSDPNTLIYGHNMLNGSMFGTLKKYRDKEYFEQNDTMYIYTVGHILKYKVYSAFVYDDSHILGSFNFGDPNDYQKFIDVTLNPSSKIKNVGDDVEVTNKDKIITLSTCTNNENERYLVVAVLQEDVLTK